MSFLGGKDINQELKEKETILNKSREKRRKNYIDEIKSESDEESDDDFYYDIPDEWELIRRYETDNEYVRKSINEGHYLLNRKLLFSYDAKPIPYIITDNNDYLIDGTKCFEIDFDEKLKGNLIFNEFICIKTNLEESYENPYEYVKFYRDRTASENQFMSDYYSLLTFTQLKRFNDFKPKTINNFTIQIFNELKNDVSKTIRIKNNTNNINTLLNGPTRQITFTLDNNNEYPYRSYNKLKSLYDDFDRTKYKENIKHYNNFDVKQSKKTFGLKTYSRYKNSFIGDIFFESNKAAFLLLININTRFAYAYQLGEVNIKEVNNVDENNKEIIMTYATKGRKTTKELKKAFERHLKICKVNILRFDGEKGVQSKSFKELLKNNDVKFIPAKTEAHTSLSLIDRLCRTLRDIAFNLGYYDYKNGQEGEGIVTEIQMNKVLNYYNTSRHETLSQTLFKAYPELKEVYDFISPWIMENNEYDLETKFVKECIKHNLAITSQDGYYLNKNDLVQVYNNSNKLEKKRTKILKDDYKIINKEGNIYKLQNLSNNKTIFKPRYQIRGNKLTP